FFSFKVFRNLMKRIITETLGEMKLRTPFDIVITATPTIVGKLNKEIKRDLKETINNLYVNENRN
ncbi:MAG: ribonuclease P protein component, partial [Candidatus Paceibacterota bacterium]